MFYPHKPFFKIISRSLSKAAMDPHANATVSTMIVMIVAEAAPGSECGTDQPPTHKVRWRCAQAWRRRYAAWRGAAWRGAAWRGVTWRGAARRGEVSQPVS